MLSFLPGPLRGVLGILLYVVNTLFWAIPLVLLALFKLLLPVAAIRKQFSHILNSMASCWILVNNGIQKLFLRFVVLGPAG